MNPLNILNWRLLKKKKRSMDLKAPKEKNGKKRNLSSGQKIIDLSVYDQIF